MAQESIRGWGGKRENQTGRPKKQVLGEGEVKAVAFRVGSTLLEQARQRWPYLTTDSDLARAALAEAAGYVVHNDNGLTSIEVYYTAQERQVAAAVLALLADHRQVFNVTGTNPLDTQIELANRLINERPDLFQRLEDAGYRESFQQLVLANRERLEAARSTLPKSKTH